MKLAILYLLFWLILVYWIGATCNIFSPGVDVACGELLDLLRVVDVDYLSQIGVTPRTECSNHSRLPETVQASSLPLVALTVVDRYFAVWCHPEILDVSWTVHIANTVDKDVEMHQTHRVIHLCVALLQILCDSLHMVDGVLEDCTILILNGAPRFETLLIDAESVRKLHHTRSLFWLKTHVEKHLRAEEIGMRCVVGHWSAIEILFNQSLCFWREVILGDMSYRCVAP